MRITDTTTAVVAYRARRRCPGSTPCASIPDFAVQERHALEERAAWDSQVVAPDGGGSIVKDDIPCSTPWRRGEPDMDGVRANAIP